MAAWQPRGPWAGIIAPGPFGATGQAGTSIATRDGLGIASLIATEGGRDALAAALKPLGLALPATPRAVFANGHSLIWAGPEQWLLVAETRAGFAELLRGLGAVAAVSDQSDGRATLRLSGPKIRDALAKGCMIDLHPAAFPVGAAALTSIAYMGVQLWRLPDDAETGEPVFEIMTARSMAGSFWSWLSGSAAEFGCMMTTGRG
jgi:sarcosine oxidase subunit gamma